MISVCFSYSLAKGFTCRFMHIARTIGTSLITCVPKSSWRWRLILSANYIMVRFRGLCSLAFGLILRMVLTCASNYIVILRAVLTFETGFYPISFLHFPVCFFVCTQNDGWLLVTMRYLHWRSWYSSASYFIFVAKYFGRHTCVYLLLLPNKVRFSVLSTLYS